MEKNMKPMPFFNQRKRNRQAIVCDPSQMMNTGTSTNHQTEYLPQQRPNEYTVPTKTRNGPGLMDVRGNFSRGQHFNQSASSSFKSNIDRGLMNQGSTFNYKNSASCFNETSFQSNKQSGYSQSRSNALGRGNYNNTSNQQAMTHHSNENQRQYGFQNSFTECQGGGYQMPMFSSKKTQPNNNFGRHMSTFTRFDTKPSTKEESINTKTQNPQSSLKKMMPAQRVKPERFNRIFTCTIEALHKWTELKISTGGIVMFEIFGLLDSSVVQTTDGRAKEFVINDETSKLRCIFYEIDRELPRLQRGQMHRVIGRYDAEKQYLKCITVRPAAEQEQDTWHRNLRDTKEQMDNLQRLKKEQ